MDDALFVEPSQSTKSAFEDVLSCRRCKRLLTDLQKVAGKKRVDEELEVRNGVNCCPQVGARSHRVLQILIVFKIARYHVFEDEFLRSNTV